MHHFSIGVDHHGKRVLTLIDLKSVTIVHLDTGEINTIDPERTTGATT